MQVGGQLAQAQRVVARQQRGVGQAGEQPVAAVMDRVRLAVHRPRRPLEARP